MRPSISIVVPHFQTPWLSLLCLRLLRSRTVRRDYETIVIDNGSLDGSGEQLGQLPWIRLLRREVVDERPALAHGRALDLGVREANGSNVLIMHTDTMVLRGDWLDFLSKRLEESGPACAAVGSWKMESEPPHRRLGKWLENVVRQARGRTVRRERYLRSHCALFRREALLSQSRMFEPSTDRSAGQELHAAFVAEGREPHFLDPSVLGRYVRHLNHATMALNEQLAPGDRYMPRTRERTLQRMRRFFNSIGAEKILADPGLDR